MIDTTKLVVPYMILIRVKELLTEREIVEIVEKEILKTFKGFELTIYKRFHMLHVTCKLGVMRYEISNEELFGDIKTYKILRLTKFEVFQ